MAFETGGLRAKLERYQGENVDVAFWGWNQAWLDPAFERWNIEEFLPRIRVPVLVVQGREDPYGTVEQLRRIERGCGTLARTVLLEACGHSPHRDQGPATLAAIAGFVREVGEPARAS